jgi:hypothetical protein
VDRLTYPRILDGTLIPENFDRPLRLDCRRVERFQHTGVCEYYYDETELAPDGGICHRGDHFVAYYIWCMVECRAIVALFRRTIDFVFMDRASPRLQAMLQALALASGCEVKIRHHDPRVYGGILGPIGAGEDFCDFTNNYDSALAQTVAGLFEMEACHNCWDEGGED